VFGTPYDRQAQDNRPIKKQKLLSGIFSLRSFLLSCNDFFIKIRDIFHTVFPSVFTYTFWPLVIRLYHPAEPGKQHHEAAEDSRNVRAGPQEDEKKQEMVRRYAHLAPSHLTEYAKQIDAIFGRIVPNLSHMGLRDGTDD